MNFTWVDGRKLSTLAGNGINASYVYNGMEQKCQLF